MAGYDVPEDTFEALAKMRLELPLDERHDAMVQFISPVVSASRVSFSELVAESIMAAKGKTVVAREFNFPGGKMVIALSDEKTLKSVMLEIQRRANILSE